MKIRKEGQGKEDGSASAKGVLCVAIQVYYGNAAFLLMAEAMVATTTALLSTVTLGASLLLGAGTMTIILGLLSPPQRPRQQRRRRADSGVGGDPTLGATSRHSSTMAATFGLGNFWFGLSPLSQNGGSSFCCIKLLRSQLCRYTVK